MKLNETITRDSIPASNRGDYEPLPDGWYDVVVKAAEIKKTKAGTGEYISIRYDVTGPSHAGRVVWGNINHRNPNPKAEEIGRQQLGELMSCLGLQSLSDTDELVGHAVKVKLTTRKSDEYGDKNEIKAFKAVSGPPAAAAAPVAKPARAVPPWAKK